MFSSTHYLQDVLRRFRASTIGAMLALTGTLAWADDYANISRLIRAGQLVEAQTKADLFLSTKPQDPQMRFLKGVILNDRGKPLDAIAIFSKLTQDYPELPEPHNNLAVLYASQNQYDKAKASLEAAIKTNPSYSTAHENLGDVYAKLASIAYEKALQLDGANPAVPSKLALIKEIFTSAHVAKPNPAPVTPPPVPSIQVAGHKTTPTSAPPTPVAPPAPAITEPIAVTPVPANPVTLSAPNTPTAARPSPVNKPAPVDNDLVSKQEAEEAVNAWAAAWSDKDLKRYFAAYGASFDPPGKLSRSDWEEERKARILGKSRISVKLSGMQTTVNGKTAIVKFRQDYKADDLEVSNRKALTLVKSGELWLIVKEGPA